MKFIVIPAIDLYNGKVVRFVSGDPRKKIYEEEDAIRVAKRWVELNAKRLHVIDLNGAIEGVRKNQKIVEEISKFAKIQFGGGIRRYEDAKELLDRGIQKIILGTLAIEKKDIVSKLVKEYGSERIIVALDVKKGFVTKQGWRKLTNYKLENLINKYDVDELLVTNIDVEGKLSGINEEFIKKTIYMSNKRIIISGGISSIEDIMKVKKLGAFGVVIGSALYLNKINFLDAKKLEE